MMMRIKAVNTVTALQKTTLCNNLGMLTVLSEFYHYSNDNSKCDYIYGGLQRDEDGFLLYTRNPSNN